MIKKKPAKKIHEICGICLIPLTIEDYKNMPNCKRCNNSALIKALTHQ